MAGSVTYELSYPIARKVRVKGGDEREDTIAEVEVRRINGGDVRWLDTVKSETEKSLGLIARLTGLDKTVVDQLDAEDIAGIAEVIEGFTPASPKSGGA